MDDRATLESPRARDGSPDRNDGISDIDVLTNSHGGFWFLPPLRRHIDGDGKEEEGERSRSMETRVVENIFFLWLSFLQR